MGNIKVGQVGFGYLGKAYNRMFKDAVVYDPYSNDVDAMGRKVNETTKEQINECDIALVAVPTDPLPNGELDMSIVEETIDWLETPLILVKSACFPGTIDRLVEKTGKKIAVSVEFIGMGSYYQPPHKYPDPQDPSKHQMLIVGGELDTATKCAEILWNRMSPDIKIHLLTAKEAEIVKLIENSFFGLKMTWINTFFSLAEKTDTNFIRMHQAWSSDGRVDAFHQRTVSFNRAWKSHCLSKDIPALVTYAKSVGADDMYKLFSTVLKLNEEHLKLNER